MERRAIGSLTVPIVGLGTNNFGTGMTADEVPPVVAAALDAGIDFFDTSDSYGESEERFGKALGRRRSEVLVATKFGNPVKGEYGTGGARPEYVRRAVDASLRRLGTDRIDLYQLHRPDPLTPIAGTLGALQDAVRAGKVREIGCSNFSAAQLREAQGAAGGGPGFVSVQNHCDLLHRDDEDEVLPACEELGIAYLPYFPLASGVLTGKYARGAKPPQGNRLERWGERAALALVGAITADVPRGRAQADPTWRFRAACRGLPADVFIPERGANITRARAVCASCPVRAACLAYGLHKRLGVWGGTKERQRRRLRREGSEPAAGAS